MPAKKPAFDPLQRPGKVVVSENIEEDAAGIPRAKLPPVMYAQVDGRIIVELVKFGQLILARCEDDTMYFMQNNGTWAQFVFEVITERS